MDSSTIIITANLLEIQKSLFFSTQIILQKVFSSSLLSTWFLNTSHKLWNDWQLPNIKKKIPSDWENQQKILHDQIIPLLSDPNKPMESLSEQLSLWINKLLKIRSSEQIHPLGQVFTPFSVVDQILDQIEELRPLSPEISIVDFASGSGHFIIRVLIRHFKYIWQQTRQNHSQFLDACQRLQNTLIACDIDSLSLYALFIFSTLITIKYCFQREINIDAHLLTKIPFLTLLRCDFLEVQRENLGFSPQIILGNPPYVFSRDLPPIIKDKIKHKRYRTSKGQFDLADVFLEHSLTLLAPSGVLGVIIAEPILTLHTRSELRRLLIESCQFLRITSIPRTFVDASVANIIVVGQSNETSSQESSAQDSIRIQNNTEISLTHLKHDLLNQKDILLIPTESLQKQVINWARTQYMSIDEWNQLYPHTPIRYFRGVEIGKNGQIMQCEYCQKWMPYSVNRRICIHCKQSMDSPRYDTLIRNIFPNHRQIGLVLKSSERWFLQQFNSKSPINGVEGTLIPDAIISLDKSGITYKLIANYNVPRIIVRQLLDEYRLCAGLLSPSVFTSQSIYNIILPPILHPYQTQIVQHLQSDLILFYLYHTFTHGKRLFSRILISKLRTLPLISRNFPSQEITSPPDFISRQISILVLSLNSHF